MEEKPTPGWQWLLLLLAIVMPVRILAATSTDTFWVDEAYTVLLADKPLRVMLAMTSLDAHPPLFYLLVKLILEVASSIGLGPSVLLIRLPSLLAFGLFLCLAWFLGRWLLGNMGGTFYALLVATNGMLAEFAGEGRNYSLLVLSVGTCFLLLALAWKFHLENGWTRRRAIVLWGVYTACATLALWLHLLAAVALFHIGMTWLVLVMLDRFRSRPLLLGGFIANATAVLLFSPWLFQLRHQLGYLAETRTDWMTPADFSNWHRVYLSWYPFNRHGVHYATPPAFLLVSSLLLLVPVFLWLATWPLRGSRKTPLTPGQTFAVVGLLISLSFVSTLWLLAWFDVVRVFHGPRYPVIMLPIWLYSMVGLTLIATRRLKIRGLHPILPLIPLILIGLGGQVHTVIYNQKSGRSGQLRHQAVRDLLPPHGATIHVSPSILIPYMAPSFRGYTLAEIESIAGAGRDGSPIHVLVLSYWKFVQDPMSRHVHGFAHSKLIGEFNEPPVYIPYNDPHYSDLVLYTMNDPREAIIERILNIPRSLRGMDLTSATAVALPEQQLHVDGFSTLEMLEEGEPFTWAVGGESLLRFDRPIPAGDYILHVLLMRHPHPEQEVDVHFQFDGEGFVAGRELGEGFHHLQLPMTLNRTHHLPTLRVTHPIWRPADIFEGSQDDRELMFLLIGAAMEPADQ